jgi:hypothetical protein
MADMNGDAEKTIETTVTPSGVAVGDGVSELTLEQGFDALVEWKSSLAVYGSQDPLIMATAFYCSSDEKAARQFWRYMGEAVRKAEMLQADLTAFLELSQRFPRKGVL